MRGNRRENCGAKRWWLAATILLFLGNTGWQSGTITKRRSDKQAKGQQTQDSRQGIARETIKPSYNLWVSVTGGVVKPGKIVFDKRTMMLSEAVIAAGGITATARTRDCVIIRGARTGHSRTIKFDWKEIQRGKAKDVALKPGDNIYIEPGHVNPGFHSPDEKTSYVHPPWAYDFWWVPLNYPHN